MWQIPHNVTQHKKAKSTNTGSNEQNPTEFLQTNFVAEYRNPSGKSRCQSHVSESLDIFFKISANNSLNSQCNCRVKKGCLNGLHQHLMVGERKREIETERAWKVQSKSLVFF